MLAFIGSTELLVAAVVGVLLFGGRLPEVMRQVGRTWIRFRRALNELKRESGLEDTLREIRRETDMDLSGPTWRRGMDHAAGPTRDKPAEDTRLESALDPDAPSPSAMPLRTQDDADDALTDDLADHGAADEWSTDDDEPDGPVKRDS